MHNGKFGSHRGQAPENNGRIVKEHQLDSAENNGKNSGCDNDVEKPQARSERRDGPQINKQVFPTKNAVVAAKIIKLLEDGIEV